MQVGDSLVAVHPAAQPLPDSIQVPDAGELLLPPEGSSMHRLLSCLAKHKDKEAAVAAALAPPVPGSRVRGGKGGGQQPAGGRC